MSAVESHFTWECPRSCRYRVERRSRRAAEVMAADHMSRRHGINAKPKAMELRDTEANAAAEMAARVRVMIEEGAPESVSSAVRAYKMKPRKGAALPKGTTADDVAPRATAVTDEDIQWRRRARLYAYYGSQ